LYFWAEIILKYSWKKYGKIDQAMLYLELVDFINQGMPEISSGFDKRRLK